MDRKQRLVSYFNSTAYVPLKLSELKIVLDVPAEEYDVFTKTILELESEGEIIISKRGRIMPAKKSEFTFVGKLTCSASGHFGFVQCENCDDLYVSSLNMGNAIHGDKVLVKKIGIYKNKPECSVIKVLQRDTKQIVGQVLTKHGRLLRVRPDDKRYFKDVYVSEANSMGVLPGSRVVIDGIRVNPDGKIFGRISQNLGNAEDIRSLISSILIENKIKTDFDNETIAQCNSINETIKWSSKDREDLRQLTTFTIDGEHARDFDDAVSIELTDEGKFRLGVHIADVSEYVTENSPLDCEALLRGTSVYLPDRVIPMLPEKLSNGLCSLNPGVDRLTLSVFMDIDAAGNVVDNRIVKSVICSNERLTYTDINTLLTVGNSNLEKRYSKILSELKLMEKLAAILRKRRFKRGAVDFDFPEVQIITDNDGNPVQIEPLERGVSNRMIEEFMLVANETVAEFAFWSDIPCIYRSHEAPSAEKLTAFMTFLRPFGLSIKGKIDEANPVKPKAFEQILSKVKGTSIENIISKTMLRSMMKADYKAENTGHFGLAASYYCHFTSPIRRYPDLVVHRSIKRFLDSGSVLDINKVRSAAKTSSEKEILAETCERDCDDLLKAAYMSNYIGMDFEGVVSGVTSFGMFVELNNGVEGLVRIENMSADYYVYSEQEQTLTGEHTGECYTVGDAVSVCVVRSDVVSRKIDFVISSDVSRDIQKKFDNKQRKKIRRKK